MAINGTGAVCTAVTLVVVLVSKFVEGAWVMILLDPRAARSCSPACSAITSRSPGRLPPASRWMSQGLKPPLVLLPIRGWSAITRKALRFALEISPDIYALHVADDENAMAALEDGWKRWSWSRRSGGATTAPKLIVVYSPYRRLYSPLKEVVTDLRRVHPDRDIAVIVPELIGTRWYHLSAAQPDGRPDRGLSPAQRLPPGRRDQRSRGTCRMSDYADCRSKLMSRLDRRDHARERVGSNGGTP